MCKRSIPATPFGSSATTGTSLFGSSAAKPATGGLFGGGSSLGGLGATQQAQQQQATQQQQVIQQYHPFVKACGNPQITGNDNDKHIANLNQIAAALGVGKAPYKEGNQVQTFNMEGNVFEKFVRTDDEGIVSLVLRHPIANLNTEERRAKILEAITNILGNQQNLKVQYAPGTSLRELTDGFTEICIIVKEGGFTVGACKFAQVLNDAPRLTQLETQLQVDKTRVLPKVGMSKAQKDRYLETVPDGVDERIWRQAIAENPAPNKLLPVAVRGWQALRDRQKAQVAETKIYHDAMHSLADRIEKSANDHARANVEMEQIRNRHKQLSYRLIRILLAQWISARFSRQIDTDEDQIEAKCDTLLAQINRNHQIKYFIDKFYEILETKPDQLQEAMFHQFDMKIEDQNYARRFLTALVYSSEQLIAMSNLQVEELETLRRTLEG
uniref:Nup54 domain-containing protein n=1 Tax=Caenorhabditis japonica TaxID=281687 RepID=A0A8R1E1K9_CAEJA